MGLFKGILNPKNAVESGGGGFQEGLIRVDDSAFVVFKMKPREPKEGEEERKFEERKPHIALKWSITRLDEETQEPLVDEEGDPQTETLYFGLGGSSLTNKDGELQITPGDAEAPVDDFDDVKDLGDEPDTEGPTLYFHNREYKINKQAGLEYLFASLGTGMKPSKDSKVKDEFGGCGAPDHVIDDCWAPHFKGLVCHMKSFTSKFIAGEGKNARPVPYKIVDKIVIAPWDKKKKKAEGKSEGKAEAKAEKAEKAEKATKKDKEAPAPAKSEAKAEKAASGGGDDGAEKLLTEILTEMSGEKSGQPMTTKALRMAVNTVLEEKEADGKTLLAVMALLKPDSKWLTKNAGKLDIELTTDDDGKITGVTFGE